MVETPCIAIGTPSDFGGNKSEMLVLANSAPYGIDDGIDTCDIKEAFGNTGIPDETIFKLFTDKSSKLLPEADLQKRVSFFKEYPKLSELDQKMKALFKKEDPKTFSDVLEWYYGQVTIAHQTSGMLFISEEQGFVSGLLDLLIYRGDDAFAAEIIKWLCGSLNFPEVFFLSEAEALVEDHWEKDIIDHKTGEIKPNDFLTACITAAPDARKSMIADLIAKKVITEKKENVNNPKPAEDGKKPDSEQPTPSP